MVLRSCSFTSRFYLRVVLFAGYLLFAVLLAWLASLEYLILAHGQLFPTKIGVKIPLIYGEFLG